MVSGVGMISRLIMRTDHESKSYYDLLCDYQRSVSSPHRHSSQRRQLFRVAAGALAWRDRRAPWELRSRQCGVLGRNAECAGTPRASCPARTPRGEPSSSPCSHRDRDLHRCLRSCRLPVGSDETWRSDLPVFRCAVGRSASDLETRVLQPVNCTSWQQEVAC